MHCNIDGEAQSSAPDERAGGGASGSGAGAGAGGGSNGSLL